MDTLRIMAAMVGLTTMGEIGAAHAGSPYDVGGDGGAGGYHGKDGKGGKGKHGKQHRHHAPECQVVMRDRLNGFGTLLTSDGHGYPHDLKFKVTSSWGDWDERASFDDRNPQW